MTRFAYAFAALLGTALSCGCVSQPTVPAAAAPAQPETLFVHQDGRLEFRDRLMAHDDVIIYPDGNGGERAAIRIRMEPLHPDFFRDSIVVERHPQVTVQ